MAALAGVARPVAAHGPPAAVNGIAARDDAGPRVVTLTEGLGVRLQSGWRWICPSAFGASPSLMPPAQSVDGKRTFVVGEYDLFVLESDGEVVAQSRPDLSRQSVLQLAPLGGRLYALRFTGDTSDIVVLDAPDAGAIWHEEVSYQSITPDGDSLWVARVVNTEGYAVRLTADGSVAETLTFAVDAGDRIVGVQRVAGAVYVNSVTAAAGGTLVRLDPDGGMPALVLSSNAPISGPVAAGGSSAWAASDLSLQAISADGATPHPTAYPVTCVAGAGDAAILCTQTQLFGLDSTGPQGEIFNLASLQGPQPYPDAGQYCSLEWEVFDWDLSRAGVTVPLDPADAGSGMAASSGGGCAVARDRQSPWIPIAFAGLLLARRRSSTKARGSTRLAIEPAR
jgi:hypothetical protein